MSAKQTIRYHKGDLPDLSNYQAPRDQSVAIDTEALGLNNLRDRLCVVQLSPGDGTADVVQIAKGQSSAPNIEALLADEKLTKIYHFARFDVAIMFHYLGTMSAPNYCTKIASKLTRTYTDRHGLKNLTQELLGVDISKVQQSSDWAADELTQAQLEYAASDVLYLHDIRQALDKRLAREERSELAQECFKFLPARAKLDLAGWNDHDIFSHQAQ
jgi:ribonuclease D